MWGQYIACTVSMQHLYSSDSAQLGYTSGQVWQAGSLHQRFKRNYITIFFTGVSTAIQEIGNKRQKGQDGDAKPRGADSWRSAQQSCQPPPALHAPSPWQSPYFLKFAVPQHSQRVLRPSASSDSW